jgi:hypothetical protein
MAARKLLPQMPEEIFKLWFDDRIEANDWPPSGPSWEGALRKKPMIYWAELQWKKCSVKIDYNLLTESSKEIICGLTNANFNNKISAYSFSPRLNSKKKLMDILNYIRKHYKLPNPLIFIYANKQYEIVDGSHRLTIFFQLQKLGKEGMELDNTQEAWIGEIK